MLAYPKVTEFSLCFLLEVVLFQALYYDPLQLTFALGASVD